MDLVSSVRYPDEIFALLKFKFGNSSKQRLANLAPASKRCYSYLNQTSRSFAAVIQALDGEIRHAVCVFYLVLRALDTVEDDMTIPVCEKIPLLRQFYVFLQQADWKYLKSQEKDKLVLEDFPTISHEFRMLAPIYQDVISDICRQMGDGMTVFLERGIDTEKEWDEYCHYVAGVVGVGLSRLFSASGLEDAEVGQDTRLSNSMGLFLQKTNIIRDYLEDINDGRVFWPKKIWGKHCQSLVDFKNPANIQSAVNCLNELVANALQHVPDCIEYLSSLKNQSIFNFCAIPQVMAIATLERCFNNPQVFKGVVKIRKGEAVKLITVATNIESVKSVFQFFTSQIAERVPASGPSKEKLDAVVSTALAVSQTKQRYSQGSIYFPLWVSCSMMVAAIGWKYWNMLSWIFMESQE